MEVVKIPTELTRHQQTNKLQIKSKTSGSILSFVQKMSGNSRNQPNGDGGTRGGGGCGGRMSWGEQLGSSLPSRVNRNFL